MASASTETPAGDPKAEAPAAPAAPAAPTIESRGARLVRHANRVRLYIAAGLLVALIAVFAVLVTANTSAVKLDWAVGSTRASLVWVILAAAVLGWLLGITTAVVVHHRTRRPR